jgi:hypothetical protein
MGVEGYGMKRKTRCRVKKQKKVREGARFYSKDFK